MPRAYGITNAAPYASAPAVGVVGDTYWNTTDSAQYVSDGAAWIKVGPGAGGPPSGAAGGDLLGSSYPAPTIAAGAVTRAKTAADCWLSPVPAGGDVGKVLTVATGPTLEYQTPAGGAVVARVKRNNATALSVPHNTVVFVDFDTEDVDTGAFWSAGSPTLFTIPTTGLYLLGAYGYVNGTMINGYRMLQIEEVVTGYMVAEIMTPNGAWSGTAWATNAGPLTLSGTWYCTAGLTFRVRAFQTSGNACTLLSSVIRKPNFWIMQIG